MKLQVFFVDNDWSAIARCLLSQAAAMPLAEPDEVHASNSEVEMWLRVGNAIRRGDNLGRYTAAAMYQRKMLLSFVMTSEPSSLHLSMVHIIPGNLRPNRVPDPIAMEAARGILGPCEERPTKSALKNVRHFFRQFD